MNIVPVHEKLLVRPFPKEKETASGIIIPDTIQERPSKATVLAVGNGLKDRPMEFNVGDIVYHVKNCGVPIQVDNEVLFLLRDVECLAKIEMNGTASADD